MTPAAAGSAGGVEAAGVVAAGSPDTAGAAVEVLRAGGNAFDAVVAAGFAAAVAEPGLSSLGGGGFLLARTADDELRLFDFFVDSPGRGRPSGGLEPHFLPVTVRFAGADQIFHAGWGTAAVPGCLPGYLHVHRRLGRLALADVVAPARRLAAAGAVLAAAQATVLTLLERIVTLTPEGRAVFAPRGELLRAGDLLRNEALADFLDDVAAGRVTSFAHPTLAGSLERAMDRGGGLLTAADVAAYRVIERPPLLLRYRDARVATNPPPSFGGSIVADGLAALDRRGPLAGWPAAYLQLARVLVAMTEGHLPSRRSVRGTTHISVLDRDGNAAAMTTSNGSCSGVFVPGTGVQLNNVMGESDLHPNGFHATPPGLRIGSMMAPTVVTTPGGGLAAVGSGGSERIRSTLLCVLTGLLDRGLSPAEAVQAPRLHWDRSVLQVEPGLPDEVLEELARAWPVHVWPGRDLYFGGANVATRGADGAAAAVGDDRRGGAGRTVPATGVR